MRWLLLFSALFSGQVLAHKASDSFLSFSQSDESTLSAQWDISLQDLERVIGLDQDNDGLVTWGELSSQSDAVFAYALPALQISSGAPCTVAPGEVLVSEHAGDTYASLSFTAACNDGLAGLAVSYALLFDTDPGHRGFFRLSENGRVHSAVFAPADASWTLSGDEGLLAAGFFDFVREGIWHIWIGYDHIAFLLLLLLPAVLRRKGGQWIAESSMRSVAIDVTKIVTAFTLAHSITLSAAALNLVNLPGNAVEMAIAASVVFAGLHNIFPDRLGPRWILAFGFGLIHGFGFANVLSELGNGSLLLLELIGFNLGVEIGQLAIALVFVPMIFLFRSTNTYRQALVPLSSLAIAVLAGFWFYQRAFIA